jgi:hypothetical protein
VNTEYRLALQAA